MRYHLIRLFLSVVFFLASRRKDSRRYLSRMEGRCYALRVRELDSPFIVRVENRRLRLVKSGDPEAEIVADTGTFLKIIAGRLDTDAAFFHRKLRLNGSLPAAMHLKILMDFLIL